MFHRPHHDPVMRVVSPLVVTRLEDATTRNDHDARCHIIAAWAEEALAEEKATASCDICKTRPAIGVYTDVTYVTGHRSIEINWVVPYAYTCDQKQCQRDAHEMLLQLRVLAKKANGQHKIVNACIVCMSTDKVFTHKATGAFYCAEHVPLSPEEKARLCTMCRTAFGRKCAGCGTTIYCTRECQKAHWPTHKLECQAVQHTRDIVKQ